MWGCVCVLDKFNIEIVELLIRLMCVDGVYILKTNANKLIFAKPSLTRRGLRAFHPASAAHSRWRQSFSALAYNNRAEAGTNNLLVWAGQGKQARYSWWLKETTWIIYIGITINNVIKLLSPLSCPLSVALIHKSCLLSSRSMALFLSLTLHLNPSG